MSSLAIGDCEDGELAYTMRDLPPRAGHTFPGSEMPMMDREPDSSTHPHTPGTPTFTRPLSRSLEPELVRRGQLSSMSSLDSPMSPSRPKSPWGRFDPYDSAEVMLTQAIILLALNLIFLNPCLLILKSHHYVRFFPFYRIMIRNMLALRRCLTKCTGNL